MSRHVVVLLVALAAVVLAPFASAQYCGLPAGGPFSQNLIVDGDFGNNCPIWEFGGAGYRATDGGICYGQEYYARLTTLSASSVSQRMNNIPQGQSYALSYVVQLNGIGEPLRSAELWGNISDANTGQILAYVVYDPGTANFFCQQRYMNLGAHPEWVGRDLRVTFYTNGGAAAGVYKITYVGFWVNYNF
jgi:hypothetical protein